MWGQAGADLAALGGNTANPDASISLANNPAVFGTNKTEFASWMQNRFTGTALVNGGLAFHLLKNHSAFGLSAHYQGTALFRSTSFHLNGGQRITDYLSLGFAIGYTSIQQGAGYGNVGRVSGKIALQAKTGRKFDAAAVLSNPWAANDTWSTNSPRADIAVGYAVSRNTKVYAQFKTQPETNAIYGLALVYKVQEKIVFRAAFQNGYEPVSAGVEWQLKNLRFSAGTAYHSYLGFSPAFALKWQK
jgi:hypothetical protein